MWSIIQQSAGGNAKWKPYYNLMRRYGNPNIGMLIFSRLDESHRILFCKLDDDRKLYHKIRNKLCPNSIGHDIDCDLSLSDILDLMESANIKSSDWSRGKYDLARYNDQGGYTINNCRFITHSENILEKVN